MFQLNLFLCLLLVTFISVIKCQNGYFGKYIGEFPADAAHNVKGRIFAPTEDTIYIKGFHYDGAGPDAFFWAGSTPSPNQNGFIIPDELGRTVKLNAYKSQNVLLKLPDGKKLRDIKWIAIWCRKFAANFAHIEIPFDLDAPKELNLGPLPTFAHGTRADSVIIKDAKTIQFKRLFYDGAAPDAFFMVGQGNEPHSNGIKVPDENGSLRKIHGYRGQDVTLRLPQNVTVFDIDWIGLYCLTYTENFGHVQVPPRRSLNIPADLTSLANTVIPFMNCETIFPDLMQVSWEIRDSDIYIQLEGRVDPDIYMAFGISGNPNRPQMEEADVTLVYFDSAAQRAEVADYFLTAKSQCAPQSQSGACPDTQLSRGRDDSQLISWNFADGLLKVTYRRPLDTGDFADKRFHIDSPITTIAAIGPLNSRKEASYHNIRVTPSFDPSTRIFFNRVLPQRNCKPFILTQESMRASLKRRPESWEPSIIKNEKVFRVQIGPTGGDKGYKAITGHEGWGIAYWVNGMLIPEIHVNRGENYTFIVEAGNDPNRQAKYHPLYITNNATGGGGQDPSSLDTPGHLVYAGIRFNRGLPDPSPGAGHYCELKHKTIDVADKVNSLEEYKGTLYNDCDPGDPAIFIWKPDENTPDVVYYQCFTHRHLGWKIIVNYSHLTLSSFNLLIVMLIYSMIHFSSSSSL